MVCKNRGIHEFLGPSWVLSIMAPRNSYHGIYWVSGESHVTDLSTYQAKTYIKPQTMPSQITKKQNSAQQPQASNCNT